jgi:hypothetical protein
VLPSLDAVLDELALAYYWLLELSPLKKAALLAACALAVYAYVSLRDKVERLLVELQVMDEEARRSDPSTPAWWKGWHIDWHDAVDGYLLPLWAHERAQREQAQALWREQLQVRADAAPARGTRCNSGARCNI